ncbi:pleiotropic drug resistance protein 1-like [Impatiens glandulifera]|uniref:pleiotropic drug resistance protein 1-like n=1 Tax=Impatiens glandulifera TaxID=253017 RepID=UPI001FB16FFA|nr:pleiotropic drug resistance protein 1-like [Impatiens glandulifera]
MRRGISGGQKKRLTLGEMLVGPARVFFMDGISTGLDSSTTYQIVSSIRKSVQTFQETALISLLQPAPETYALFDDIILLSDGQIVYQGPCDNALEFFEYMGFKCPERKEAADFLQEVTSRKDQPAYWARENQSYRYVTAKEFARAFWTFHVGRRLKDELDIPFDKDKCHSNVLTKEKYGISNKELFKVLASREYLLMKRNSLIYIFKMVQLTFIALIAMTMFLRTQMPKRNLQDGGIFLGALFLTLMMIMFNGYIELALSVMKLPVFFKQRNSLFFPAWAYTFPIWILKTPVSFVEVAIWVVLTYYPMGLDSDITRFFKQYLLLLCVNQAACAVFQFLAAVGRTIIVANTIGTFMLLTMFIMGGFVVSRVNIPSWGSWTYWTSPMMYGQNAIAVNEFLGKSWSQLISPNSSDSVGVTVLKLRGLFPESYWYWIGVGASIGYAILFNVLCTLALTYLQTYGKHTNLSEEAFSERNASIQGGQLIELSSGTSIDGNKRVFNGTRKHGMILPFKQVHMTFENISYDVDMPKQMKGQGIFGERLEILRGVSGVFKPGVLVAVMGVTGAGKTTLMDVLAGRKTGGYIKGKITISGYPKKQETFARIAGYCEQTDIHSPQLTVFESLQYSSWLRLPPNVNSATKEMFVDEIMELVELNQLRNALVGLSGVNGLSIEQRKRLTIAVELVANPSIIFMDEPTTGLDARAAAIVMRTVRNTVDTGRTVVCTIHQPSVDIFDTFDELILLKQGGEEIYSGPLGRHCSHLINYFEGIPGVSKIKEGYNPATWMLEVTSIAQEDALGIDFTNMYKNSELYKQNKAVIEELSTPAQGSIDLHFDSKYSQPFFTQCIACLWKQHLSYWRNPTYTALRLYITAAIALILGALCWNMGSKPDKVQDLLNSVGSMYVTVAFLGASNATLVQPIVDTERTVFYRERAAGMYSAFPYAFGQVAIEIPHVLLQIIVYVSIVYPMMGFEWTVSKFFWYTFFTYFSLLYFTFYGMMAVAITPNHSIAGIVSSAFYLLWNLFSGFIVPISRIPVWWKWYYYVCPVAWTIYGLVVSQYGDKDDILDNGSSVKEFLESYFGFKEDYIGNVAGIVFGFSVMFGVIFAFSIKAFNFQKR